MIAPKAVEDLYKWIFDTIKNLLVIVGMKVLAEKNNSDTLQSLSKTLLGVYIFYVVYTAFEAMKRFPIVERIVYGGNRLRFIIVQVPFYICVALAIFYLESTLTAELIRVQLR